MSEYIVTCDEETASWIGNDIDSMKPLVRCRDCARFIPQGTFRFNSGVANKSTCEVIRGFVVQIDPDGFCAWGKKKVGG